MTTYSRSDLATRILRDGGLIGAEETPSAPDLLWVEETISSTIGTLAALQMPIWNGSDMEIPQEYLVPLSRRIWLDVAPSFGFGDVPSSEVAKRELERVLGIMAAPNAGRPLTLRTNDIKRGRGLFNYSSGTSY